MFRSSFPPAVPFSWLPLPSTGSSWVSSPASAVLRAAPTSADPSRRTSFPWLGDTPAVPRSIRFSRSQRAALATTDLGFGIRSPDRHFARGDLRISQVPGEASWLCSTLRPRRRLHAWPVALRFRPRSENHEDRPHSVSFRGCIVELDHSLCTLRRADRSTPTQHSVPAGGQPLPGRTKGSCGPPIEVSFGYCITPPPPSFAWRNFRGNAWCRSGTPAGGDGQN